MVTIDIICYGKTAALVKNTNSFIDIVRHTVL